MEALEVTCVNMYKMDWNNAGVDRMGNERIHKKITVAPNEDNMKKKLSKTFVPFEMKA